MGLTMQAVTQASVASVLEIMQAAVQAAQSTYTAVLLRQPAVMVHNVAAVAQASAAAALVIIAAVFKEVRSTSTAVLLRQPAVMVDN